MKVFILNPPIYSKKKSIMPVRPRQPLSLAYIASLLLEKGYDIELLDANVLNYDVNQTVNRIKAYNPDILILTSTSVDRWECPNSHIDSVFEIINKASINPTILTGTHGSLTPEWIFKKCDVNFIVRGEPEMIVLDLIKELSHSGDISEIKGISYRVNVGIIHNEDAPRIENLDSLPFPAYNLLPMEKYRYTSSCLPPPFSIILTSRGCPFNCIFCLKIMSKGKYIARSPENVVKEIEYLVKNFNIKSIFFQDWEFTIDKERVEKICDLIIRRKLNILWACNARANNITDELVRKMKKAGCVRINIGFESGSQKILDKANKGIQVEELSKAIEICQVNKIDIGICVMLNLPGEDKETIKETINFLDESKIESMTPNLAIPYFGTKLFEKLKQGKKGVDFDWDNIENYAGRIDVSFNPRKAKFLYRFFKFQSKFGRYFWLKPLFYIYLLRAVERKL